VNIKSAVKFTSLKELETERDQLAEETIRLRMILEEEHAKKFTLKTYFPRDLETSRESTPSSTASTSSLSAIHSSVANTQNSSRDVRS
jgi:hypothetical protein